MSIGFGDYKENSNFKGNRLNGWKNRRILRLTVLGLRVDMEHHESGFHGLFPENCVDMGAVRLPVAPVAVASALSTQEYQPVYTMDWT